MWVSLRSRRSRKAESVESAWLEVGVWGRWRNVLLDFLRRVAVIVVVADDVVNALDCCDRMGRSLAFYRRRVRGWCCC